MHCIHSLCSVKIASPDTNELICPYQLGRDERARFLNAADSILSQIQDIPKKSTNVVLIEVQSELLVLFDLDASEYGTQQVDATSRLFSADGTGNVAYLFTAPSHRQQMDLMNKGLIGAASSTTSTSSDSLPESGKSPIVSTLSTTFNSSHSLSAWGKGPIQSTLSATSSSSESLPKLGNLQIVGPPGCSKTTVVWMHALLTSFNTCILWTRFRTTGIISYVLIDPRSSGMVQHGSFSSLEEIVDFLMGPTDDGVSIWYVDNVTMQNKDAIIAFTNRWWVRAPWKRSVVLCSSMQSIDIPAHFVSMNFTKIEFGYSSDAETLAIVEEYWPHCFQKFATEKLDREPTCNFSDACNKECLDSKRMHGGNKCALILMFVVIFNSSFPLFSL